MSKFWDGDYSLDLQLKYMEQHSEWWLYDVSMNYKYSYIWKWKVKPTKNMLRVIKRFSYLEARSHFDWELM